MPAGLRLFLLGAVAVAFAYIALHVTEPLRLTVGDPWSDAELVTSFAPDEHVVTPSVTHTSPLAIGTYRAVAALGARDIGTFRVCAFAISILGAWLLFQYLRRMWGSSVALIGTALFTTSTLWITFADSLQHPPLVHAACFLALWGLVRAIETEQLRYHAIAAIGSFLCMFAAGDAWLVLGAGVIVTIAVKRGDPFSGGNGRFILVCAVGYVLGMAARSACASSVLDWRGALDRGIPVPIAPTLTLVFTPLVWVAALYAAWRVIRAASVRAALEDAMSWLLVFALVALAWSAQGTVAPTVRALPILPFYAIGGALAIDRMLRGHQRWRGVAIALCVIAPAWALWMMVTQPRPVLERDDVASTRAYFAYNDGNDFVISNLLADGVIGAGFDRRSLPMLGDATTPERETRLQMLQLFESTDTRYIHAVIFTTPDSRFVDRSLAQLRTMNRRWPVTWYPTLFPDKANGRIRGYDAEVHRHLEAVAARMVLHFTNFDVYRIDRATVFDLVTRDVPVVHRLDLSSELARRNLLLGWDGPKIDAKHPFGYTSIGGYATCDSPVTRPDKLDGNRCELVLTEDGPRIPDELPVERAQLLIRVERMCDLRFTVELAPQLTYAHIPLDLASTPQLGLSMNGFAVSDCTTAHERSFVVPEQFVHPGVNVVTLSKDRLGVLPPVADVRAITIECN